MVDAPVVPVQTSSQPHVSLQLQPQPPKDAQIPLEPPPLHAPRYWYLALWLVSLISFCLDMWLLSWLFERGADSHGAAVVVVRVLCGVAVWGILVSQALTPPLVPDPLHILTFARFPLFRSPWCTGTMRDCLPGRHGAARTPAGTSCSPSSPS